VTTVDRREHLLRLLRSRADWTVGALAERLDVSRRTILRDITALRDRGFGLDTLPGPGGGVRLDPTSVMITSQLRADEVVALILSVAIARAARTVPFAAEAEPALNKIERSLPPARAIELRACRERILVGDPSPATPSEAPLDPGLVGAFEAAFSASRILAFRYRTPDGRTTRRLAEPHGLLVRPPLWYVIAWDTGRDAPRLFRADRISEPEVTDRTFVARPNDLVTGVCPDARPPTATAGSAPP
jgi:predicted DNA-binding transcriptional regulator YafY